MEYEDFFKALKAAQRVKGAGETMNEFFESDVLEAFFDSSNVTEQLDFAVKFVEFTDYLRTILDKYPHKKREDRINQIPDNNP